MIGSLSRRERLLVGTGLAVALVLAIWRFAVEPVVAQSRLAAELAPSREQVLQQRVDLIGRREAIAQELKAVDERLAAAASRFLTAATPAVAAAELQKLVKETAALAKTDVRSERILQPAERGELLEIPIEIAVSGEIRQLVDFLAQLDGVPKLLTVQDLKIRVVNPTQPRELLATLTVSGFILPEKAKL